MALPESQLTLFDMNEYGLKGIKLLPLEEYSPIIFNVSGGKDSLASIVHLLELGVDRSKCLIMHQCVDGYHGDTATSTDFWDWPCTQPYILALGELLGIPVRFQWRDKGLYGELLRNQSRTADVYCTASTATSYTSQPQEGKSQHG